MSLQADFDSAQIKLKTLSEDPGNVAKLKIYGLFKQSTVGQVNTSRPGMINMVARAKWDAWDQIGSTSKEDAMKEYITFINTLVEANVKEEKAPGEYEGIVVTVEDGLRIIRINRPEKLNSLSRAEYFDIPEILAEAAKDDKTVVTAFTGTGGYFSSGNDLSMFSGVPADKEGKREFAESVRKVLLNYVAAFIDFPKPLIGVVNGPAIGIGASVFPLFDAIYASERATINFPFSALGQSPEGCSSYTFPRAMGTVRANELLMFNKKITASQARDLGLVTAVFPEDSFEAEVWPLVRSYAKLPTNSLIYTKALQRDMDKDTLHRVNAAECERLLERWQSDDCMEAVMNFFKRAR